MKFLHNEEGASLVETLVAMAILLVVLVPSTMFLTYIGSNWLIKDKAESFQQELLECVSQAGAWERGEGKPVAVYYPEPDLLLPGGLESLKQPV